MNFFGKKKVINDKVRMPNVAPSFLSKLGKGFNLNSIEELKDLINEYDSPIIILLPSSSLISKPRELAKALSFTQYLIIYSNDETKEIKTLLSEVDKLIFSPVMKNLSGSIVLSEISEIESLVNKIKIDYLKEVIIVS